MGNDVNLRFADRLRLRRLIIRKKDKTSYSSMWFPTVSITILVSFGAANIYFCEPLSGQHPAGFDATLSRQVHLRYLLALPREYSSVKDQKWPLIMYLHGGSRRGDDIEKLRNIGWGLPAVVENDVSFPFVVLSPQCPQGEIWTGSEALAALLNEIIQKYSIDSKRVYLTGHSMGGRGTWYLAYKHPQRFAAIAPMSGSSNITWPQRLKHIPIWAFHGRDDQTVRIRNRGNGQSIEGYWQHCAIYTASWSWITTFLTSIKIRNFIVGSLKHSL